ncbi:hypothetical protein BASA81_002804 [Batrachochytrium salamandrivorans]|nr:hypothetical protein BASA81_002804 [Batrachochytrium salamandrivorans]
MNSGLSVREMVSRINPTPSPTNSNSLPPRTPSNNASSAAVVSSSSSTATPGGDFVQQRRASAVQTLNTRRTSTTFQILTDSRTQDERGEETRTIKRRSTVTGPTPQQQAELIASVQRVEEEEAAVAAKEPVAAAPLPVLPPPAAVAPAVVAAVEEDLTSMQPTPLATLDSLPALCKELMSGVPERELMATIQIRTMLSQNVDWIQTIINTPNIVSMLVSFLDRDKERRLQFEATWSLTNIASGTSAHTLFVVRAGALGPLVRLLDSSSIEIREQAVWAIGNIAGDSPELRDSVIDRDVVPILIRRLDNELSAPAKKQHPSFMRNAVWTIANLVRGKPAPQFAKVKAVIPVLGKSLDTNDVEMQADACWALNYLGDGDSERIQALVDSPGVCAKLVSLMEHPASTVKTPALRAVGNVVTGDDSQTEHVISLGVLPKLRSLLVDQRHTIRGEACWTISNITAGNHTQIQKVLNADIVPRLIDCAKDTESYVAKEAVWAITNATSGGTTEQIMTLGRLGCIPGLIGALENAEELNNRVVVVALEGISNFLAAGDMRDVNNNEFVQVLTDCGGEALLKNDLRHHVNDDVRMKATEIVVRFFETPVVQNKPPPEMWTPDEVLEEKKKQAEAIAKQQQQEEEASSATPRNRRGSAFVPPQFFCPISQELMLDPVSTVDGHVYDRLNIQRWFNTGKMSSPVTGQALASTQLTPNHPLRQMIESYRPGYTHRADLDTEWNCVACTMVNKPTDMMCTTCGAEKPLRKVRDPDAVPASQIMSGDF